jgi:hypothetical protein
MQNFSRPAHMTAIEVFNHVSHGGASDFESAVRVCEAAGAYCLIGGLAVNCYVEPVYTMDADLVVVAAALAKVHAQLQEQGFVMEEFEHSLNARQPGSQLSIQFTKDPRYQTFAGRAVEREVFGLPVRVACMEDIFQGKLWAYGDARRRRSKREKDRLDLIRLAEAYPSLRLRLPTELQD